MTRSNRQQQQKAVATEKSDLLKWAFILLLIVAGICADTYFADVALGIRMAAGIVLTAAILSVVAVTAKGRAVWEFIRGARSELRKVVWPTKQETLQTTLLVVVVVIIVALILWGLDAFFFWAIKLLST